MRINTLLPAWTTGDMWQRRPVPAKGEREREAGKADRQGGGRSRGRSGGRATAVISTCVTGLIKSNYSS